MMNVTAIKRMETFADTILSIPAEKQDDAWKALETVLTPEELKGLKQYVGFYHLMTDQTFYKAMEKVMGEMIYNELRKGE